MDLPAGYEIDESQRMIFSRAWDVVTAEDLHDHQGLLTRDPRFDPAFSQLWDLRAIDEVTVESATLRELAQSRSFASGARRALVAPSDVSYGLARMFQSLHDDAPEKVRVFRDVAEARAWLGLEPAKEDE